MIYIYIIVPLEGRKFRDEVAEIINEQMPDVHIEERMLVEVVMFPPDKRIRDVDNYNKALLDSITCAGIWADDALIDQLFNYRGEVRSKRGSIYVRITDAGPTITDVAMLPTD